MTKKYLDELTHRIIGAAIEVHKALGPGLLESVYQKCSEHEYSLQGISFQSELPVPIIYKGVKLETDFRADFFIEEIMVVEFKAVQELLPIHEAQLLTYMKLLKAPKGIIINFCKCSGK